MSQPRVTTESDDMPEDMDAAGAEPSLDALLNSFMGKSGWPEMDTANIGKLMNKQLRDQQQALRKEALAFRACFATPDGRKVLELILNQTLRAITWPVMAMANAQDLMAYGVWREGQNALVANIIEAIAAANNTDVKPRSMP
jgi:hypothetical protein